MLTLQANSEPGDGNLDEIMKLMTKRDILANMEYAERRKKRIEETQHHIQPKHGLNPWLKVALVMVELFLLSWVLYGVGVFVRKAFSLALTIF